MRGRFFLFPEITLPQMAFHGHSEAVLEQCGEIREYDSAHARLQFGKGEVEICGKDITLLAMTPDSVIVRGCFESVRFLGGD